jgi:putative endonuclease
MRFIEEHELIVPAAPIFLRHPEVPARHESLSQNLQILTARASKDDSPGYRSIIGILVMNQKMGAFVYMLKCADGSYYVGTATGNDLTKRIAEHNAGVYSGYTSTRRPVPVIWSEYFPRITDAIAVERQLKGWTRAKKEALVKGDWGAIQQLAKRRSGKPRSS